MDLPWRRRKARLLLTARRFGCTIDSCSRHTFGEDFGEALPKCDRRTKDAMELLLHFALKAGGEEGARLSEAAGLPVSPNTLPRMIGRLDLPDPPTPRVPGVDDLALRRRGTPTLPWVQVEMPPEKPPQPSRRQHSSGLRRGGHPPQDGAFPPGKPRTSAQPDPEPPTGRPFLPDPSTLRKPPPGSVVAGPHLCGSASPRDQGSGLSGQSLPAGPGGQGRAGTDETEAIEKGAPQGQAANEAHVYAMDLPEAIGEAER